MPPDPPSIASGALRPRTQSVTFTNNATRKISGFFFNLTLEALSYSFTFLVIILVKVSLMIGSKNIGGYWLFKRITFAFSRLSLKSF